jgi:hypothetical protein
MLGWLGVSNEIIKVLGKYFAKTFKYSVVSEIRFFWYRAYREITLTRITVLRVYVLLTESKFTIAVLIVYFVWDCRPKYTIDIEKFQWAVLIATYRPGLTYQICSYSFHSLSMTSMKSLESRLSVFFCV